MRGESRADRRQWRALPMLGLVLAVACNALTGVNDLEYRPPVARDDMAVEPPMVTESLRQPCDARTGQGCVTGQICRFSRESGEPVCRVAAAAVLQPYAACQQDDDCPAAFLCEAGVCSKLCQAATDCGWPNARCLASADAQRSRCSRSCDLVTSRQPRAGLQACGEGTRCDFVPEVGATGYTDCFEATGSSFDGASCTTHADCPADFRCQGQRCTSTCAAGGECPVGLACASSVEDLAGQLVGACCSIRAGWPCDLLTSCGCGPGFTCSLDDAGAIACRALSEQPLAPYSRCTQHAECPGRHSCIDGACKLQCELAADCGAEGTECVARTLGEPAGSGGSFCARGCDVLSPQAPSAGLRACGVGATCVAAAEERTSADCFAAGTGVQGASCQGEVGCSPGFACVLGVCERWCAPGGTDCGLGLTCSAIRNLGGRQLGSCCAPPLDQACDWLTDCGCAASETCSADASAARFCREISPTAAEPYDACNTDTECPRLHHCFAGACMQRCETSAQCARGTQCLVFNDEDPDAGICSRNCDMLSPSAPTAGFQPCGPGLRCLDFEGPESATTVCLLAGTVGAGGACSDTSECGQGLDCDGGLCLPLCEIGASDCADGAVCSLRALATAPVGGRTIGVCRVPEE